MENIKLEMQELSAAIEDNPAQLKGNWRTWRGKSFSSLLVDYGSGMGDYCVELAASNPDTLYIGVELELFCIVKAACKALDAGLQNVVFVAARDLNLSDIFAPGEVDIIQLNFPTPYPRARDASKRLVSLEHLMSYRSILAPDGKVRFKTDSKPLFDFALAQFELAGYELDFSTDDLREAFPQDPITCYEKRTIEGGARIFALQAKVGELAGEVEQTSPLSLYDYLPDDLESLDYIPIDMQRSVSNSIEARRRVAQNREAREQRGQVQ